MEKKKILVTGASGLLGRHTLEVMHKQFDIHAVVRTYPQNPIPGISYIIVDFSKDWNSDHFPHNVYAVFHFAQSDKFREFPDFAVDVFNVNVASTIKLLDYSKSIGVKKFIFTSTGGIYDNSLDAVNENSPINSFGQLGNYFATKLCSEILTHNYTGFFDVTLLRLFFMYGKEQKRSMLIPRLVDSVKFGRPIKISGKGGILINPIHVSDVVCLLEKLLLMNGSYAFNVAGPEVLSLYQITEFIANKLNLKPIYEFEEKVGTNCIANTDLVSELAYQPVVKLFDKISDLI